MNKRCPKAILDQTNEFLPNYSKEKTAFFATAPFSHTTPRSDCIAERQAMRSIVAVIRSYVAHTDIRGSIGDRALVKRSALYPAVLARTFGSA